MPNASSIHQLNLVQHIFGTSRTSEIINFIAVIFILALIIFFIVMPLTRMILDILDYRRLKNRKSVCLELTPPTVNTKTLMATAEWYNSIHGLLSNSTRKDRLLHRKNILPLEIVTSRDSGIRFIARLNPDDVAIFKQLLVSYLPAVRFRETEDYLQANITKQDYRLMDFKQAGHFTMPLSVHDQLSQHDPIAYITGSMAKPLPDELTVFQLILAPASRRVANKVRAQLLHGKDTVVRRKWWYWPFIVFWKLIQIALVILGTVLELLGEEMSGNRNKPDSYNQQQVGINPSTKHVIDSVHHKLDQPLFSVDLRILVVGANAGLRAQGLTNSLHQFHVPGYQGFTTRSNFPKKWKYPYRLSTFCKCLPAMITGNSNVLSTDEVASLYHFPYGEFIQGEDIVQSLSKTLPAPVSMKHHSDTDDYDVMLGVNKHHGSDTMIGLTSKERQKHVYLIGGTGNGKTTMLEYALLQDINSGKGVAFIDPHGDAAQKLLRYIPKSRINDVVYVNPLDISHPIGINLLELPKDLSEDDLLIEKDRVAEAAISVLRKVFADDDANAHRIEAMFRNAIHTALTVEGATLFTVLNLLRNTEYRNTVVSKLDDEFLIDFWREEFGKAGNMQRVSMSKGLTHRIDRFRSSAPVYRMLSQAKSTISFEDIIDTGKILICNFTTDMGEDTSTLFGTTILAKLKIAAERRSKQPEDLRLPFYVYVDEFQNFATTPFVKMLSASRKYKLFLTIAEQSTAQQEEQRLTEAILANISTLVCFGLGSPADERLLLGRFKPWLETGNLTNLPAYNFYMRVKAVEPMAAVSGETIVLSREQSSTERSIEVVTASRKNYATVYVKPKAKKIQTDKKRSYKRGTKATKAIANKSIKRQDKPK